MLKRTVVVLLVLVLFMAGGQAMAGTVMGTASAPGPVFQTAAPDKTVVGKTAAMAVVFTDTFTTDPTGAGGAVVTSFSTGTADTGLLYTFTSDGGGCDVYWQTGNNVMNIGSGDGDTGTLERYTIVSRDGKAFVFTGMWYSPGPSSYAPNVTITGLGPEPFVISTGVPGSSDTYAPAEGDKLVTSVEVTSVDFYSDWMDDVDVKLDVPGMDVQGNSVTIVNGDATPSTTDHTDFGTQAASFSRTFTIRSIGDQSLDLTGSPYVTLTSNPSGDFSVSAQPTTDPIASGGSDTFTILCNPSGAGERTAVVSITNDSEASPYTFTVKCTGDPSLSVALSSFEAHQQGRGVLLNWRTESEVSNLGFVLKRQLADGPWQTLATYLSHDALKGQGSTSQATDYSYLDETAAAGTCSYRLSDVDAAGTVTIIDALSIDVALMPEKTALKPAYPNPFNPSTKIQYELAGSCDVTLKVVDIRGRLVQTLVPGETKAAGVYSIHWNGLDNSGMNTASGIYFLVLEADGVRKTQKVMLVR